MEKVIKQVEVAKHADGLATALVTVAKSVKAALADGWQPGTDIPAVLLASYQPLISAMADVAQVPAELSEDPAEVALAFVIAGSDVYKSLK